MEIQRERGGDGEGRSIYAKQQRARRAKPSDGVVGVDEEKVGEETVQQSKTETAARKMRAKSAHVRTFADAEGQSGGQQIQLRKSPKLGRVRLRREDETPESERNLTLPCPWTRCKDITAPGTIKSFLFLIASFGPY